MSFAKSAAHKKALQSARLKAQKVRFKPMAMYPAGFQSFGSRAYGLMERQYRKEPIGDLQSELIEDIAMMRIQMSVDPMLDDILYKAAKLAMQAEAQLKRGQFKQVARTLEQAYGISQQWKIAHGGMP